MGTFDNLYLNQIKKLQEENNKLRAILNEANIRRENLPNDGSASRIWSNSKRNISRKLAVTDALSALVDPNNIIHSEEMSKLKGSVMRVLADMGHINLRPGAKNSGEFNKSGPGTGTANREDMERFLTFQSYFPHEKKGGFKISSVSDFELP